MKYGIITGEGNFVSVLESWYPSDDSPPINPNQIAPIPPTNDPISPTSIFILRHLHSSWTPTASRPTSQKKSQLRNAACRSNAAAIMHSLRRHLHEKATIYARPVCRRQGWWFPRIRNRYHVVADSAKCPQIIARMPQSGIKWQVVISDWKNLRRTGSWGKKSALSVTTYVYLPVLFL